MPIAAPFIRRPIGTMLLLAGLFMLGAAAYRALPVDSLPNVALPTLIVQAALPGASPEVMASAVATPLERELGRISGLSEMSSQNTEGVTSIFVQFSLGHDPDAAFREVAAAINAASASLPADLPTRPIAYKADPAAAPVMLLAVSSDTLPMEKVYDIADRLVGRALSRITGVGQVTVNGGAESAIRVRVNPNQLAALDLDLEDLRQSLATATRDDPKGQIQAPRQAIALAADDQLLDLDGWRRLVVAWRNDAPVRLGDVATVVEAAANTRFAGWSDGQPAVLLSVAKQPEANLVATVDRIRDALPDIRAWLPPSVSLTVFHDRTQLIRASIAQLGITLAQTVVLVVLALLLCLRRFWLTLIPSLTIPAALAGTVATLYLCRFSLDNLSLMAATITLGFAVDDIIVVVDNIVRHRDRGQSATDAAISGSRQVAFTIASTTISLLAAFLPLFFMSGVSGLFLREFAVTLGAGVAVSAVLSLTVTPMLCATVMARNDQRPDLGASGEAGGGLRQAYLRSLSWALLDRRTMLVAIVAATGLSIYLYAIVPKGFLPLDDTGAIGAVSQAPSDISFDEMWRRQRALGDILRSDPAVERVGSWIGSTGWTGVNKGQFYLKLKPLNQRDGVLRVIDRLRGKAEAFSGMALFLSPIQELGGGGPPGKSRYQVTLEGETAGELAAWSAAIRDRLRALPELDDVNTDEELGGLAAHLSIDRAASSRYGVPVRGIDDTLYDAFGQRQVATLYSELAQSHVILEVDPAFQQDPSALGRIWIRTTARQPVPLGSLTTWAVRGEPLQVNHRDGRPAITIGFTTRGGVAIGQAVQAVRQVIASAGLPPTIRVRFSGEARLADEQQSLQPYVILAAIIVIYMSLGVLYESFAQPLTILSTLPAAGLGALIALLATGTEFSLVAMIGLILLFGIVKKNAIIMVDFAQQAERYDGLSPAEAILRACGQRFRPIMMTSLVSILAALPILLGSGAGAELRRPLGIVVAGGSLISQILTLYTTPVIYLYIAQLRRARGGALPFSATPGALSAQSAITGEARRHPDP